MAPRQFRNLRIINLADLRDLDSNVLANAVVAVVPELIQPLVSAYDLAEAIQNEHQIPVQPENISYYGPGFFAHLPTARAKTQLLQNGFAHVGNLSIVFVPWKADHGSIAVPLQEILSSTPRNLHLARDKPLSNPYERLAIEVSGVPPQLYCASTVYKLFDGICIVNRVTTIEARLEFDILAHGQLSAVPDTAHVGIRGLAGNNETVHIWPLKYEVLTGQMRGRDTPPEDRVSELRGFSVLNTSDRNLLLCSILLVFEVQ